MFKLGRSTKMLTFFSTAKKFITQGNEAMRRKDWPEAIRIWALMREKCPENPRGYVGGIAALKENRNFEAADTLALEGMKKFPEESKLYAEYGDIATRRKDWLEAIKRWALMREKFPEHSPGYIGGVTALKKNKDFEAADALILEGLEKFPNEPKLYKQYGDIAARKKNWPEAIRRWTLMREKCPENPRGYFSGAEALKECKDFKAADALILEGLEKFPDEPELYKQYGDIVMHQKDWPEAVRRWALMREKCPEHPYGYSSGAKALKKSKNFEAADALAIEGMKKFPEEQKLYAEYGDTAAHRKDWPEAAKRWALMRKQFPEHPRGYFSGAEALKECEEFEAADALILKGLEKFPDEPELYKQYGDIAVRQKNWTAAIRRWTLMREKCPEHPHGYSSGAKALKESKNVEAADALVLEGLEKFPDEPELYKLYGDIARRRKNWREAIKCRDLRRKEQALEPASANKDFLFSFVITACGAKRSKSFLTETVESILAQTIGFGENIQIVLTGDSQASDNEAAAVRENYRQYHPNNIILLDLPNGSPDAARNAGLKAATGHWLNFLEPGDKWDSNACEAALDFFLQYPKINVACFPITLFGANNGMHWLNYKFKKTRTANIFKDPDSVVLDLCSCFCAREAVQNRSFDEDLPISSESAWIAQLLLDEQDFALIAKTYCRCRSTQSSATETMPVPPSCYPDTLRPDLDILRHARERYGEAPEWAQYVVMLNLCRRLREEERNLLTPAQKEKYRGMMRDCLKQIDDRIICAVRNLWQEERLIALALKHGMTYEQIREWIKPDGKEKSLRFCRPGAEPVPFAKLGKLWLESMDIAEGQLLLRGSCAVLATPSKRMRLVLAAKSPDGDVRKYPCELLRQPDLKKRRLFWEDDFWPHESFELALPITSGAKIRAFAEIDGLRFNLKWAHKSNSPFVRGNEQMHWKRAGHTVSQLPDNTGLYVEPWCDESSFLFSFIIPAYNVKQYLTDAVESVLAQSIGFKENIQIVLVNDGSTDGTGAVCKRYRDLWPENIVYIDKPNGGVSSARNEGIKAATGHYIGFLDADDKWDPGVCEAALNFFEMHSEVNIVCFPIMFFGRREGAHWLNYKFKQTKVANIFKDTDYAVLTVWQCIMKNEIAKHAQPFDESLSIAEDSKWITKILLDEQIFGIIAKPNYRYRKRFTQNSALDTNLFNLSRYLETPRRYYLERFHYAKEKYGEIPSWLQYAVMLDLTWRIKQQDDGFLTLEQKEEYRNLMRACLTQIDDPIICTVRNLFVEEQMCALALKYDMTYEQIKKWIMSDEKTGSLYFCRPNAQPIKTLLKDMWATSFRLEFMDIVDGNLLLRGSCHVLVPRERMIFVFEMVLPNGNKREYLGKLYRKIHRKKHLFFEDEIWAMESFELSLPLVDGAKVQAFVNIDGVRFDLKWQHERLSPFVRGNKTSYLNRAGYIVSKLPNDEGLFMESETSRRVQELEDAFLEQVAAQSANSSSTMLVARIRRAARKMRRLSKRPIWLISDRIAFAGDNGEALFEYLMAHPDAREGIRPIFVLSKDSPDWERLKEVGPTVAAGSVLHKILFLAADKVISSSADADVTNPFGDGDFPYRSLFNFDFVFLQHGVTKDDQTQWLNQANKNISLFVTAAQREHDSIVEGNYGYTADKVLLTGFPRHDKLLRRAMIEKPQRLVAVMPTWRKNLEIARDPITGLSLSNPAFEASEYFQFWNGLLNHPRLLEALRDHDYRLRFAIHPQSTHEGSKFKAPAPVEIVFHCDYPQTFCEASLLVTDYSSVAFDFALLRKPLVYAHFDYDTFFSGHLYSKGYFDYKLDGFGPVCPNLETTVDAIIHFLENDCRIDFMYREREDIFFGVQPENRCQAVTDAIKKLGRRPN